MPEYLLYLLLSLKGVPQDPRHHPEGDALYHALQALGRACQDDADPELLAAALFHDVGKAVSSADHAARGAEDLEGFLPARAVWLVRHHMDVLRAGRRVRRRLEAHPWYGDLVRLRRWDLEGRVPGAQVMSPEQALELVLARLQAPERGGSAAYEHDSEDDR